MKGESGYRALTVWKKAIELVILVYKMTEGFPKSETYGLISQMRRCAISIPSNIAEGSRRKSKKDFAHFLTIAFGSGSELETQMEIVKQLSFGQALDYPQIESLLTEVMKMLNKMIDYQ